MSNGIKYGVLDTESTTFAKGNPYSERNKLCIVGLRLTLEDGFKETHIFKVEYDSTPYGPVLEQISRLVTTCPTIVGFNLKHDLGWLARYGIRLSSVQRIFDCQLAYFIYDNQRTPYPSLNGCLAHFGLPPKSDVVEREYWSVGIDTTEVPLDILTEYNRTDLDRTDDLYQRLVTKLDVRKPLVTLHMQDLRVLLEMESNGLCFNWADMGKASEQLETELQELDDVILAFVPEAIRSHFNTQSGDHLSALLYGGSIGHSIGTPYQHTFKMGNRAGQTETRHRWEEIRLEFPRLVEPIKGSELKKDGFFSVDEQTLTSLKTDKVSRVLVEALLSRADKEKLLGTYYHGIPKIAEKYDWKDGFVHGTFNQCRVITGRLSSEKPNQQNRPEAVDQFVVSRFAGLQYPEEASKT